MVKFIEGFFILALLFILRFVYLKAL